MELMYICPVCMRRNTSSAPGSVVEVADINYGGGICFVCGEKQKVTWVKMTKPQWEKLTSSPKATE